LNKNKIKGPIEVELTGIGAQCRGERHQQVISRQKEAINDLRQQVKALLVESKVANEYEIKNQLILLKKELAEVRAAQALSEDIKKYANLTEGNEENFLLLEAKTAHFDTQNAFEYSEDSFLTVMRTLLNLLQLNDMKTCLKSMAQLPDQERIKLRNERVRTLGVITNKIKHLKESLERKEEVLKDYEIDLGKLRQAEFLLDKKTNQLDEFQLLLRQRQDEIDVLQETLKNTRSELDNEKLLNSTLKQRKKVNKKIMKLLLLFEVKSTGELYKYIKQNN